MPEARGLLEKRAAMRVKIRDICQVIRSKQAGPFRLTFDIVFKTPEIYHRVKASKALTPRKVAALYHIPKDHITDFVFYDPGWALKVTLLRPRPAGDPGDGDLYGCQQHAPLLGLTFTLPDAAMVAGKASGDRRPVYGKEEVAG